MMILPDCDAGMNPLPVPHPCIFAMMVYNRRWWRVSAATAHGNGEYCVMHSGQPYCHERAWFVRGTHAPHRPRSRFALPIQLAATSQRCALFEAQAHAPTS
jgi:hypothetical protein